MNTTENQLAIVERPSDRKWPYVIGGFIAGVASIIGAAYLFDDERDGSSYCDGEIESLEDTTESTQPLTEADSYKNI